MHADRIEECRADLRPYGYLLTNGGELIRPNGMGSGVFMSTKRRDGTGRLQARTAGGALLWSGHRADAFVRAYWYAEPRAAGGAE